MFRTALKVTDVGLKLHYPVGGGLEWNLVLGLSASLLDGGTTLVTQGYSLVQGQFTNL